jgi:hypothetical protein
MRWRLRLFVFSTRGAFILVLDGVDLAVAGTGSHDLTGGWQCVADRAREIS